MIFAVSFEIINHQAVVNESCYPMKNTLIIQYYPIGVKKSYYRIAVSSYGLSPILKFQICYNKDIRELFTRSSGRLAYFKIP
jgi:hypothetical protein